MPEINLLEETVEFMKLHDLRRDSVLWVGSAGGEMWCLWKDFENIARDVNYDCGVGAQEIASDLVVVGPDWWMERSENNGAEWWSLKRQPEHGGIETYGIFKVNGTGPWVTLEEKNSHKPWMTEDCDD